MTNIGKYYGVSKTVISRILKENDIYQPVHHKYKANYNAFETIDSPEKAYWLGFIAADGCNYSRATNASLIINISAKDREHLEKFKLFMESDIKIVDFVQKEGYSNNTSMCKIVFNSKKMSEDLNALGIVPKKSLVLKPPKINKEYYLPFILGYFDGDGSINYATSQKRYDISITGTKEILEWINDILHITSKLEKRYNDDKNNYYIRCGGTIKPYSILK